MSDKVKWRNAKLLRDRIEELEASKNEALNQLDSALYSVSVLEKRVKSLIDENADLKAKLAKAVYSIENLTIAIGMGGDLARTTLAELTSSVAADNEVKGGKDGDDTGS